MPLGHWRSPFRKESEYPQYVPGVGSIPAQIMLIGERPGEEEAYAIPPRPFIGLAGKYLNIAMDASGIERNTVYITNLVKTFNEYSKPTADEVTRDAEILAEELIAVRPIIVGLLGTFAVENVLGRERTQLERTHGIPVMLTGTDSSGRFDRTFPQAIYLPMYHPGSVIYDIGQLPNVITDFHVLAELLEEYKETGRITVPHDKWEGREKYSTIPRGEVHLVKLDCAVDTEGSMRRPWCATTSAGYGVAYLTYPDTPLILASQIVYLHNSLHDLGVLRALGTEIEDDQFRDTMVWAYLLGLEPQGLKDLAWRKSHMKMESYQDVMGEANTLRALEYLEGVSAIDWGKPEPYTIVEYSKKAGGYAPVTHRPQGINQRVDRVLNDYRKWKRGDIEREVDPRKRWGNVDEYVKVPVEEMLGEMPEATLDDIPVKKAEYYACRDADATRRVAPILWKQIQEMELEKISEIDHGVIPMVDRMQTVGWEIAPVKFWDELGEKCQKLMDEAQRKIEGLTGCRINPDSGDQTAHLLYDTLGIKPDRMTDSGKRGATNDKSLEAIASKHPVVDLVFDYREPSKVKSSFVVPLRGIWNRATEDEGGMGGGHEGSAGENGGGDHRRYRYQIRVTRVSSGRFAGVGKPNLLAIPVRSDLGKEVREGFIAPEGKVVGDWDLNQIEMREMADQSRDEGLVKIFTEGKIDAHTDTAATMFGIPYNRIDPDGPHRYAAKRVGFGVITGITEYGLVDQMALARAKRPDGKPWTVDDCANMIKLWFEVRPGVRRYMEECREEARRTGMVRSRWGRIRYLPGVWSPQKHVRGEAERQAHSFKISASAQEVIKLAMRPIWKEVCKVKWLNVEPLIQVHDELALEVPDKEEVKAVVNEQVVGYMCNTFKYPSGIPIKAKGKYGRNWAEAK